MSEAHSRISRRLADNPIAIVGMSSLFPLARDHREYWRNIVDGVDCTAEVPESRWRVDDYYDPDPAAPDKTYSRRGAFIPEVAFDPLEFGMPPAQLDVTSTMQTLSLGVARDLLRDAGAEGSDWYDSTRTGVVLGVTGPVPLMHPLAARLSTPVLKEVVRAAGLTDADAEEIAQRYVRAFAPWEENSFPGFLANVVAGRIANRFDLGGLNSTVDAACAASLSAMRMAIAELVDGRADMMITGGVDTENTIFVYLSFSKVGALSKTDRISPFADDADGTLLGEGIGMLALRRLADAQRDGNRVYAVIRGLGSSSDGRAKSIYAPRAEGQRIALDRAYTDADCSPTSVELFEAHATGTAIGDRTELTALHDLLTEHGASRHSAALGSVKSQIGHTKGAAGTASVMKLALALYHKTLPPTINVERPNGGIDFDSAPFYVNVKNRPWIRDPRRPIRRAAASAMGFGGTNFHMVLDEHSADRSAVRNLHRTAWAHVWHARDPAALLNLLNSAAPSADGGPVPPEHARIGFVASDEDTVRRLRGLAAERIAAEPDAEQWSHPEGVYYRRHARPDLKVGALFAGQGSQYLDMGLEAVLNVPTVASAFDDANAIFPGDAPRLAQAVFPPPVFSAELRKEQEATLRRTEYAQPAIGALSAGQFRFLRELGLISAGFLGHSFGELTALWAAGALTDADYFRLAAERGAAMAPVDGGADTGAMAAVMASRQRVERILADIPDAWVCNHNAPGQVVIGGGTDAVESVLAACAQLEISARRLPVSAAFHTEYVAHAVTRFRAALDSVRVGAPEAPVYANSPGAGYGADPRENAETLAAQLLRPVEFVDAVRAMHADGVTVFVEFGPKQVLTGLVRHILDGTDAVALATDAGPLGDSDVALKQAAVRLVVLGVPLTRINRYDEPATAAVQPTGMTISLSAPEYVPPARLAAYQAGLTDGFRVSVPATPTPAPPPTPSPVNGAVVPHVQEEPSMTGYPRAARPAGEDPAAQHLALHTRYLESQLRVAETVVGLVVDHGVDDPRLREIISSVKDQSVAIGHAHARAADVLARLTELEFGAAAPDPQPPADYSISTPTAATVTVPGTPAVSTLAATSTPTTSRPHVAELPVAPPSGEHASIMPTVANGAMPPQEPAAAGANAVDAESVRAALVGVVAEKTGYPADLVDPGMDLEADLGVDSIKRVQVIGAVQERFPGLPTVGPEQLGELRTLNQVVDFLVAEAGGVDPKAQSPTAEFSSVVGSGATGNGSAATPRYRVELTELPPIDVLAQPFPANPSVVLVDHGGTDATALADGLTQHGWLVRRVDMSGAEDLVAAERTLSTAMADPAHAIIAVLDAVTNWSAGERRLAEVILLAKHGRAALAAADGGRTAFITLTRLDGALGLRGEAEVETALLGGVGGVVKTLAIETPQLFCRALDLHPDLDHDTALRVLLAELHDAATDTVEVGVDNTLTRRTVIPSRYHRAAPPSLVDLAGTPEPRLADGVFVVTGGARGITARCVAALAECRPVEFVLLGRTELAEEPAWADGVADAELKAAVIAHLRASGDRPTPRDIERRYAALLARREIRATLARLHASGATASYLAVDVADPDAVRAALAGRRVTGIVHGAGVLADALLADKTPAQIEQVFIPKLRGLAAVLNAVDPAELRHLVLFTSVAGLLGNAGQADYAAANEALCRFAASWRKRHPDQHVVAIDWGAWDGGMVTADLRALFAKRGVSPLDPAVGTRAFVEQFTDTHRAESCVLIGENSALSDAGSVAAPAFTAFRDLATVERDAVIGDHRIGAHTVLPATFGLGWMINVAERAHPGLRVVRVRDFAVHRGIVFDGDPAGPRWVELADGPAAAGGVIVRAAVRGDTGRALPASHYVATLELAVDPDPAASLAVRVSGVGAGDALPIYTGATQFHGPRLQGMRHILEFTDERLVVRCRLSDTPVAGGSFGGALHSPVLADVLLQGPSVLGSRLLGQACLPLGIGIADYHAPLPDDQDFVLVVDQVRRDSAGITVTATAVDESGLVLVRFAEAAFVPTPSMAAKFAEAVARWSGQSPPTPGQPATPRMETTP